MAANYMLIDEPSMLELDKNQDEYKHTDMLYEDAMRRQDRQKAASNYLGREYTFSPKINEYDKVGSRNMLRDLDFINELNSYDQLEIEQTAFSRLYEHAKSMHCKQRMQ